jgi:hypothetical protein
MAGVCNAFPATKSLGQIRPESGAVLGGAVFEVKLEGVALKEGGVLRKEAEERRPQGSGFGLWVVFHCPNCWNCRYYAYRMGSSVRVGEQAFRFAGKQHSHPKPNLL